MVDPTEGLNFEIGQAYHALGAQAARERLDGYAVVSGLEPTDGTGLAIDVAAGEALVGGTSVTFAGGSVSLNSADPSDPRKDTIWIDDTGTLGATAGTPNAGIDGEGNSAERFTTVQPEPPLPTGEKTILAEVWVPAGATSLASADVRDRRQPADIVGNDVTAQTLSGASGTQVYDDATQTVGDGTTSADHESVSTESATVGGSDSFVELASEDLSGSSTTLSWSNLYRETRIILNRIETSETSVLRLSGLSNANWRLIDGTEQSGQTSIKLADTRPFSIGRVSGRVDVYQSPTNRSRFVGPVCSPESFGSGLLVGHEEDAISEITLSLDSGTFGTGYAIVEGRDAF